jgi:hypothetical protein
MRPNLTAREVPMKDEAERIAAGLTEAQKRLVLASEPGGFGRDDCATGVEIRGAQYRAAKALDDLGVGTYTHGSPYGDLYFNTDGLGLAVRRVLQNQDSSK